MRSMIRYVLLTLLIVAASLLLGILAMVFQTPAWKYAVVSIAVAVLSGAIVIAVASRRGCRVYWIGLALVGWGYFFLAMHPFYSGAGRSLVTTRLLVLAWDVAAAPKPAAGSGVFSPLDMVDQENMAENYAMLSMYGGMMQDRESEQYAYFQRIEAFFFAGQAAWALVLGALGGLLGVFVYRRAHRETDAPNVHATLAPIYR